MRPVQTLPLPSNVISKLVSGGYLFCEDILDNQDNIKREVRELLANFPSVVWNNLPDLTKAVTPLSALDFYKDELNVDRIVTFSQAVDQLLGGGVTLGEVIELCGASGSGKTQLCLQLCLAVQVMQSLGGVQGKAVFIDTNNGFSPIRLEEMAKASHERCLNAARLQKLLDEDLKTSDYTKLLDGVYYKSTSDNTELFAVVTNLVQLIQTNKQIKLVVIDSFNFPFLNMESTLTRTQLISRLTRQLQKIAKEHNVAVVLTNQLTTKIIRKEASLQPALGEYYAHILSKRFMLGHRRNSNFSIAVYKSSNLPDAVAEFQITEDGVQDIFDDDRS